MVYVGCDPGKTGAIASLSEDGTLITISDFSFDDKGRISAKALLNIINAIKDYHGEPTFTVCIEKSQAMPGQGTVSMFGYGVNYGILYGVITCLGYKVVEISPQKWKKEFDLNSNKKAGIIKTKEDSVNKAIELYPSRESFVRRLKKGKTDEYVLNHGRSDALLICEYARRNNL